MEVATSVPKMDVVTSVPDVKVVREVLDETDDKVMMAKVLADKPELGNTDRKIGRFRTARDFVEESKPGVEWAANDPDVTVEHASSLVQEGVEHTPSLRRRESVQHRPGKEMIKKDHLLQQTRPNRWPTSPQVRKLT